jgi:hypothetical protein
VLVQGNRVVLLDLPADPSAPETRQALSALVEGRIVTCTLAQVLAVPFLLVSAT